MERDLASSPNPILRWPLPGHDTMSSLRHCLLPSVPTVDACLAQATTSFELLRLSTANGAATKQVAAPLAAGGGCSLPATINSATSLYAVCKTHSTSHPQVSQRCASSSSHLLESVRSVSC